MFNTELIETQVLGTLFLDPSLVKETIDVLNVDMFTTPNHKNIFVAIGKLNQKNVEVTVSNIAIHFENNIHKIGGIDYLREMMSSVPSVKQFDYILKKFIEFAARRKFELMINEFKERICNPLETNFEELLNEFEQKSLEIRPKQVDKKNGVSSVVEWYEEFTLKRADPKRSYGLMTGYTELDSLTLGFQRKELFVVGARTSMGKSAFANEIAHNAVKRKQKVAMFSLEMDSSAIINRFVASMAKIPLQDVKVANVTNEKDLEIQNYLSIISEVEIDDNRGVTVDYVASEMRRLKRQFGLDVVIIDYLQELQEPNEKTDHSGSALHRICQKLRIAAKECDCFVLGLSQLKQDIDTRQEKRPFISDLTGSAAIAAVADGIILLYRDEYYNPETKDEGIIEVNLAKHRNGPTGVVKLKYDKVYQTITNRYFK